ncbi:MAG: AmmeMemoRadiSam system protein B [Acidimicrobiia bacterium]
MGSVRAPAVAGTFYPADAATLSAAVDDLLASGDPAPIDVDPMLLIVPHAGYVYSGPVAATAYRLLATMPEPPRRLVMVGPSHFVAVSGVATPNTRGLETPLGIVEVDAELAAAAEAHPAVAPGPAAHAREHSLEVQLPFLQRALGELTVLPLLTGEATPQEVAAVLDEAVDTEGVMGLISTDLSHYLDAATARRRDASTAAAVVELRPEDIGREDACGRTGLQAGLVLARTRGWACRLLDLRNSGDTAGPTDRVVGYGAFAIGPVAT